LLIIFDLDDTLIDTTGSLSPFFLRRAFIRMKEKGLKEEDENKLLELNQTSPSSTAALKIFLKQIGADPSFFEIGAEALSESLPDDLQVNSLEGAHTLLSELSQSHRLALVTFGEEKRQKQKWEKAGIDSRLFCKIVFSKQENKEFIYKKLLEELHLPPNQCIVVGDRPKGDLSGAKKLGMWTIHMKWGRGIYAETDSAWVDFEVQRLLEIKDKVQEITSWRTPTKFTRE